MKTLPLLASLALMAGVAIAADLTKPLVVPAHFAQEKAGVLTIEAENFAWQTLADKRAWHITSTAIAPDLTDDGDPNHAEGASGGAYIECLPDTRRTHADKLVFGENIAKEPGQVAILHYRARFETAGRYYVWARAYSTGSEDNGIHVGIDGQWPASGQRMQWCQGKNSWRWESKQRTEANHCGEAFKIFLDVDKAGEHEIMVSMREDGFELDKLLLIHSRDLRPDGPLPTLLEATEKTQN